MLLFFEVWGKDYNKVRFADDMAFIDKPQEELQNIMNRLVDTVRSMA